MALGTGYDKQGCYLARSLEVVGERWTLLILRDLFFGVRRFTDLLAHLDISRGVLSERLDGLVAAGAIERQRHGREVEYQLTAAGRELWPAIYALLRWGERHLSGSHPVRLFSHVACGTDLDDNARCPACDLAPGPEDIETRRGAGVNPLRRDDPVAVALEQPHRLLTALP